MRYGILGYIGFSKKGDTQKRIISIGDILECLIVRNIYKSMGISEDELVKCYQYELRDYDGEYCVLPINLYALYIDYSPRVLPVFLGLTWGGAASPSQEDLNRLRRFSPIGCRDERTMRMLVSSGIDAYLQGCLVGTFPKRERKASQTKVFFVNPEAGIKDYIPSELLDDCEFFSHDYFTTEDELYEEGIYSFGEKVIEKYADEARLVVTSKYHAAVLCLALGIPVIMVIENNYYKYSWIERFIPIYEPNDYPNIDWNPNPVCIPDDQKDLMIAIAKKRIRDTYDRYHDIYTLSEMRERPDIASFCDIFYGNYAIEYVRQNWDEDIDIEYAFWGVTDTACRLNEYISNHYANARLKKVFDWSVRSRVEYADGVFVPEPLEHIEDEENRKLFIFVTGNSASEAAVELFEKIGRGDDEFFLCRRRVLAEADLA